MNEDLPTCTCGHAANEHHTSWFPGGAMLLEECEDWDAPECDCAGYRRS